MSISLLREREYIYIDFVRKPLSRRNSADVQKQPPFQEQLLALQILRLEHAPQFVLLQPLVGGVAVGVGAGG